MVRSGNEDSLFADATPYRGVFMVADGMGGHAAGEIASEMAVAIVTRDLAPVHNIASTEGEDALETRAAGSQPGDLRAHARRSRQAGHGHDGIRPAC